MTHDGRRTHLRAGLIATPARLRFKGSGGGGTNTVTQQSGPPQQVLNNYQSAFGTAQNVAAQPYQSYGAATVAGFQPMQVEGFNTINEAANAGTPFINAASQDTTNSTNLLSPTNFGSTESAYQSPYTQQVVQATEGQLNNQNAIQQNQLAGNAASSGAFGGDRQAVAQSVLAGQQQLNEAPTIANLYNTGFQNATNTAEANAWLNSQGSFSLGNLGNEAQQQGLTAANSFLSAGGLQQQQAQNELNVPYESYLAAQAYPYQTSSFLTNAAEGLGSLSGGTGTTTSPGPSTLSQVAGLGTAGIGAYGLLNNAGAFGGAASSALDTSGFGAASASDSALASSFANTGVLGGTRGGRVAGFAPGGAVGVPTVASTGGVGGVGGIGINVPDVSVHMIGGGRPLIDTSTGSTSTTTGGSAGLSPLGSLINAGAGLAAGIFGGPAAGFAANELGSIDPQASPGFLLAGNRGGAVRGYDAGGNIAAAGSLSGVPDYSLTHFPASTAAPHGSNMPRPPPAAPTAGMGGLGDISQAMQLAKGMESLGTSLAESRGGAVRPLNLGGLGEMMRGRGGVSPLRHLDAGGSAGQDTTPAGLSASVGGNPAFVQLQQSYSGLPTETLQEIAARTPPNSPQGSLVQRALRLRQMNPGSNPAQPMVPPATPQGQVGGMAPASPAQAGGFGGMAPGFAAGGEPDAIDVSGGAPAADTWDDSVASYTPPAAAVPTAGVSPIPPDPRLASATHMLESSGSMRPGITGDGGQAHGPMQVHPAALADVNAKLGTNYTPKQLEDQPAIGKLVGDTYLAMQQQRFGSPALALAAFNAGPGATQAAVDSGKGLSGLPPSTQQYVTKGLQLAGFGPADAGTTPLDDGGSDDTTPAPTPGMAPMPPARDVSNLEGQALKPNPWEALLAAGLGMLSGSSPHAAENIGRGGLMGLQDYQQQRQQAQQDALRRAQLDQTAATTAQTGAYQQAQTALRQQRLVQSGQQSAAQLALQKQQMDQRAAQSAAGLIPPSVRETQAYEAMTPEGQADYLQVQRAKNIYGQNGKFTYQAVTQPDPDDPTKTISGVNQLDATGNTPPKFIRTDTDPNKAGGAAATSGREAVYFNRVASAGNEAAAAAQNIMELPATSSSGIFAGRGQAPGLLSAAKESLTNTLTSQDVQSYNTMIAGVSRNLSTIEAAGLAPSGALTHSMDSVILKEGDTEITKMRKLAELRQIVEKGLEPNLSNPRIPPQQKQVIQGIIDSMAKAIPFTHHDITQLQLTGKPGQSLSDMAKVKGLGATAATVPAAPERPQTATPPPVAPPLPRGVPEGSLYSPSRGMFRDLSGNMYNASGAPVAP